MGFSDECWVDIGMDNKVFIWKKIGEDWLPCCLAAPPTPKFSLMIWCCIRSTYDGVGTITVVNGNRSVNAEKYISILEDNLWPVSACHFPDERYIFQDDNAPIHRARVVNQYKTENRIHSMILPAQSPDLNIIENVWYRLKRQPKNRPEIIDTRLRKPFGTSGQTFRTVEYIRNLYSSIPKRIQNVNVLKSKGYITKYMY